MTRAPERPPLEFDDIDDVCAALRGAGHRVSAPTRAVLDALFETDTAVTAEQITERPGERLEGPTIGDERRDPTTESGHRHDGHHRAGEQHGRKAQHR